ncbi:MULTISPECIES: polysaccharide lyase family 1 protein [Alishewanella]|uniref:Pectate lyase n=1 Tax=Alishewanella aestuarii B11 TaxID=1197174 RepID=J1Q2T0_9ALTE|nr:MULTISPECIES: pectate lyase [Alishewanella]EJI85368.1 pectate lyase [Alishewanella aestuarii B11]OCW97808.1 pectate lyase [Alishewanella sp. HH-ZS]
MRTLIAVSLLCCALPATAANNLAISGPGAGADGTSKFGNTSYGFVKDGNLSSYWQPNSTSNERVSVKWSTAINFNQVILRELGDQVTSWRLVNHDTGAVLATGNRIGSELQVNLGNVSMKKLNLLIISATGAPQIAEFEIYLNDDAPEPSPITPPTDPTPDPTPDPSPGPVDPVPPGIDGQPIYGSFNACANSPQGYASLGGGTTGGLGIRSTRVTVTTGLELAQALANKDPNRPLTIRVNGTITPANSGGFNKFDIKDMRDVSIIGVGQNGILDGIGLKVFRAQNVIIRNLKIRNVNIGDKDGITIEGPARNIWIDHNEISNSLDVHKDFYDELVSGKRDIDNITISFNYLHSSWKTSLWGSSDSDSYDRRITFHHNRFENVNSRLPLFRFGQGHLFNNYYHNILETGMNSRMGAILRVEANVFENAKNPLVSFYSNNIGYWDTRDNMLINTQWAESPADGIIAGPDMLATAVLRVPYDYKLVRTEEVKNFVLANAGVGKCAF